MKMSGFNLITTLALSAGLALIMAAPAFAAKPASNAPLATGNDISYPQCGKALPKGQAFGIVGVNGGLATAQNPCLSAQLSWAGKSTGSIAGQPEVQLYVNTANPGEVAPQVSTWPKTGTTPYGACDGTNTAACSWQYGWERAFDDVNQHFIPAASAAGITADPAEYIWWLDVETENSWQSGSQGALARNRAALEGMVAYFTSVGATSGIYSTNYQWGVIAGTVEASSNLYTLNSWMAGARTQSAAQTNCKNQPLVGGGQVVLSQYVSKALDYDISCL